MSYPLSNITANWVKLNKKNKVAATTKMLYKFLVIGKLEK